MNHLARLGRSVAGAARRTSASLMATAYETFQDIMSDAVTDSEERMALVAAIEAGVLHPTAVREISRGSYGVVFRVSDETSNRVVAVKVFLPDADDDTIESSAKMYRVVSEIGIGPAFYGAFSDNGYHAIVMAAYPMSLQGLLAEITAVTPSNTALMRAIGAQVDRILQRLASVGWTCRDLKPGNFVARLLPELDVRIIDVDLLFCKPHRNMSADTITRQYLTMKAAMELVSTALVTRLSSLNSKPPNPYFEPDGPGLFLPDFRKSNAFDVGVALLREQETFAGTVEHYTHSPLPGLSDPAAMRTLGRRARRTSATLRNALSPKQPAPRMDEFEHLRVPAVPVSYGRVSGASRRSTLRR